MKKEKTIPTILGLIILIISIIAGVFLTRLTTSVGTKASGDCTPTNLQLTNISDKSASIYFQTTTSCLSNLKINGKVQNDYRQKLLSWPSDQKNKTHYFQIDGLRASTIYTFEVTSGGQTFNRSEYKLKTAQTPSAALPTSNLAWGKVINQNFNPVTGVVVFMNIPGASPLSAITTSSGNWNISLATSFDSNLTTYFIPPTSTINEEIIAISSDAEPTIINSTTAKNNPVPDITLGRNYLNDATPTSGPGNLFASITPASSVKKLSILYPKENEKVYSLRPELIGTAAPNTAVTLKVVSTGNNYEAVSDASGNWKWSPPISFIPGENSIKASTATESITRNFSVETSSGLAFESSPSATRIPTPTILPTISLTTPTQSPTATIRPTSTPVPTAVRTTQPTTESGIPKPGAGNLSMVFLLISFVLTIASLQLFNKSSNFK